jgi:hypothetical protein
MIQCRYSDPWRIAGWIGSVVFDGVVTALTLFRAVRLRISGLRVSIMETMLQDGIIYFGKHMSSNIPAVHVTANKPFIAAVVFGLNTILLITFVTINCALKVVFQRMTQVLTVLMISHMVLNLKDSDPSVQEEAESYETVVGSFLERNNIYQTSESHGAWVVEKSSVTGNLGNDLVHTSVSDVESSQ